MPRWKAALACLPAPVPGTEIRIDDDEIWVAGAHVNAHYLDPAMEAGIKRSDGLRVWHRTGDAGRIDGQGRLWLLGRHAAVTTGSAGRCTPFPSNSLPKAGRACAGLRCWAGRAGQSW